MWTSGKAVEKWRCPPCNGEGHLPRYFKGAPYSQGREQCHRCNGRGWILKRPFWPWNWVPFKLTFPLRTAASLRDLLHPERKLLEEQLDKADPP